MIPIDFFDDLPGTGLCVGEDPELWWSEHPSDIAEAKTFCVPCPVRVECLTGALERREQSGVWGGELIARGKVVATNPQSRVLGRGRALKPCGTPAAYDRHRRRGEPVDEACRRAYTAQVAEWRAGAAARRGEAVSA